MLIVPIVAQSAAADNNPNVHPRIHCSFAPANAVEDRHRRAHTTRPSQHVPQTHQAHRLPPLVAPSSGILLPESSALQSACTVPIGRSHNNHLLSSTTLPADAALVRLFNVSLSSTSLPDDAALGAQASYNLQPDLLVSLRLGHSQKLKDASPPPCRRIRVSMNCVAVVRVSKRAHAQ